MPRKPNTKQVNAIVSERNYDEIEQAIARKYGAVNGMRAQFIRAAVAAAVEAQGIEWSDDIEDRSAWDTSDGGAE